MVPMQFMGTSNSEYTGPMVPRIFKLMREGKFDEAMKLYWQIHPSRMANMQANAHVPQTLFLNRMLWKFQGWLSGFNGGPLRHPTNKVGPKTMADLRRALVASGLPVPNEPDTAFFEGRNPA
jgi:4-hydroxy-tetrahydrodipicolinate synthase